MRRRRLEQYFELMDSDNDGFISADAISLENLPTEVIEILGPVISDLEKYGVTMSQKSWVEHSQQHIAKLNAHERSLLF